MVCAKISPMAQPDRNITPETFGFSSPFVDMMIDIGPVLHRNGADIENFLEEVHFTIEHATEAFQKATAGFSILDPNFLSLTEPEQREIMYQAYDEKWGRYFHVVLRDLKVEAQARKPGSAAAKKKLRALTKVLDAHKENGRLDVLILGPMRTQYIELPLSCPHPPSSGGFFETPTFVPKDLKTPAGIWNHMIALANQDIDCAYDKVLLTPQDFRRNTEAQTRMATRMGILEEGEYFENFIRRPDLIRVGLDDQQKLQELSKIPGITYGMPRGRKGFLKNEPNTLYFGGLPTYCSTPTKYPDIRASVSFIADDGDRLHMRDRATPLDELIVTGRATPTLTLYLPTDQLVPYKS